MYRLYKKNELSFSLVWIIAYVVLLSLADNLSASCILRRSAATGAVISGRLATQRPPVIRWSF